MEVGSPQDPHSRVGDRYLAKTGTREREYVDTKGVVRDRGCDCKLGQMVRAYCVRVRRWKVCRMNPKVSMDCRGRRDPARLVKACWHTMLL